MDNDYSLRRKKIADLEKQLRNGIDFNLDHIFVPQVLLKRRESAASQGLRGSNLRLVDVYVQ
jgi:hypothetical protein